MESKKKSDDIAIEFIKKRWPREWKSHLDKNNIEKWQERIQSIIMGFHNVIRLFDTKSRRALYSVLRDFKMDKLAKELANYSRRMKVDKKK